MARSTILALAALSLPIATLASNNICPGVQVNNADNQQYCCIGGTLSLGGFDINIDGSSTTTSSDASTAASGCSATIWLSDPSYTQLVNSARASLEAKSTEESSIPTQTTSSTPVATITAAGMGNVMGLSAGVVALAVLGLVAL